MACSRAPAPFQDLLKHTPADHPDYPLLQDALRISQNFLSSINEDIDPRRTAVTTPKGEVRQGCWGELPPTLLVCLTAKPLLPSHWNEGRLQETVWPMEKWGDVPGPPHRARSGTLLAQLAGHRP